MSGPSDPGPDRPDGDVDATIEHAFARLRTEAETAATSSSPQAHQLATRRRTSTSGAPRLGRRLAVGAGAAAAVVVVVFGLTRLLPTSSDESTTDATSTEEIGGSTIEPDERSTIEPDGDLSESLPGTTWQLEDGFGPDGEIIQIEGSPITLTFEETAGLLSGQAACNGYSAQYQIDGERLSLDEVLQTYRACQAEAMEADVVFLVALGDVTTVRVGGSSVGVIDQLELDGPDSALIFSLVAPAPDRDEDPVAGPEPGSDDLSNALAGTAWRLVSGQVRSESIALGTTPEAITLSFEAEGGVTGVDGCNSFAADVMFDGDRVTYGPEAGEQEGCGRSQALFLEGLAGVSEMEVDPQFDELVLSGEEIELRFAPLQAEGAAGQPGEEIDGVGDALSVAELLEQRPSSWVEVTGHLLTTGSGRFLCGVQPGGAPCPGSVWIPVLNPASVSEVPDLRTVTLVVAFDGRDPDGRLVVGIQKTGQVTPETFAPYNVTAEEQTIVDALIAGDLTAEALQWHPDGVTLAVFGDFGEFDRVVAPADLDDPANWEFDGDRPSPLDPLGPNGAVEVVVGPTVRSCGGRLPVLPDVGQARHVVAVPEGNPCGYAALNVLLDGEGRILAVVKEVL